MTTTSRTENPAFIRGQRQTGARLPALSAAGRVSRTVARTRAGWFNAPVASFGPLTARLLIVGLAPGLQGANRTGRPFTGDYAGDLLYATLAEFGFARGQFRRARRTTRSNWSMPHHQRGALRAAGEQADAGRNPDLPLIS